MVELVVVAVILGRREVRSGLGAGGVSNVRLLRLSRGEGVVGDSGMELKAELKAELRSEGGISDMCYVDLVGLGLSVRAESDKETRGFTETES